MTYSIRDAVEHEDVEYHVRKFVGIESTRVFRTMNEAILYAFFQTATGQEKAVIDVLVHSEAGAHWYGGDVAVEQYREDPQASVFDRWEIKLNHVGKVS